MRRESLVGIEALEQAQMRLLLGLEQLTGAKGIGWSRRLSASYPRIHRG